MIITIDGPSGTGKTTVARKVAERLGFVFFDTGAMYRALTWYILEHNIDIQDHEAIERTLSDFDFNIVEKNKEKRYFVKDHDVTEVIRSRPVTAHVSAVSALRTVRSALLHVQHTYAKMRDSVFEGRDLGTVVFPDAEVKIFLTADPQVRAERRLSENQLKNPQENLNRAQMLEDIMKRDELDSKREVAPLRCPEGALQIDTTHLTIDQVVDQIVHYCAERFPDKL